MVPNPAFNRQRTIISEIRLFSRPHYKANHLIASWEALTQEEWSGAWELTVHASRTTGWHSSQQLAIFSTTKINSLQVQRQNSSKLDVWAENRKDRERLLLIAVTVMLAQGSPALLSGRPIWFLWFSHSCLGALGLRCLRKWVKNGQHQRGWSMHTKIITIGCVAIETRAKIKNKAWVRISSWRKASLWPHWGSICKASHPPHPRWKSTESRREPWVRRTSR